MNKQGTLYIAFGFLCSKMHLHLIANGRADLCIQCYIGSVNSCKFNYYKTSSVKRCRHKWAYIGKVALQEFETRQEAFDAEFTLFKHMLDAKIRPNKDVANLSLMAFQQPIIRTKEHCENIRLSKAGAKNISHKVWLDKMQCYLPFKMEKAGVEPIVVTSKKQLSKLCLENKWTKHIESAILGYSQSIKGFQIKPVSAEEYFVASDLHLGDEFMAKLRGFTSFDAYWQELKSAWNSVVPVNGHVLLLGDICMKGYNHSELKTLNGRITIIAGNHCSPMSLRDFNWLAMMEIPKLKCILTHLPVHQSYFCYKKAQWANVHGHTHRIALGKPYINVCFEQIGLAPLPLADVIAMSQPICQAD